MNEDRRVQKTRQAIQNAFVELITEKNYPEITDITSRRSVCLTTLDITVDNSNPLLYNVPGVVGLKTGTTDMAQNCLVVLMKAEDANGEQHDLVAVQFGAEDKTVRTSVSEVLIRYARQRLLSKPA